MRMSRCYYACLELCDIMTMLQHIYLYAHATHVLYRKDWREASVCRRVVYSVRAQSEKCFILCRTSSERL